jgi:hypothetical protein
MLLKNCVRRVESLSKVILAFPKCTVALRGLLMSVYRFKVDQVDGPAG